VGGGATTVPQFQYRFKPGKLIQTCSNILKKFKPSSIQKGLPEVEIFEIKYGCYGFEERNNFLHRNFSRFEMDFELKIWEVKV
jgi:hypothetical protein